MAVGSEHPRGQEAAPARLTAGAEAPSARARVGLFSNRSLLTLIVVAALLWSLASVPWSPDLVHPGGGYAIAQIWQALLAPELSPSFLLLAFEATLHTVSYAVAGLTVALLLGLPLGVIASGTLARGTLGRVGAIGATRSVLGFFRAIHELVWAWLFVTAIGLSPLAGVLALGIPYGGILGRIFADLLADVPPAPLRALQTSGASPWKVLLYGRLPQALPDMLSYTFYRFECAIRSSAILSFVGLQGLGYQIQLSLHDLLFGQVWTLLFFLVGLVVLVDLWSSEARRRLVG